MKCEIEIDLPPDVAAKWVPVAVRRAVRGEAYHDGRCVVPTCNGDATRDRVLILVPRVEWPAWCSADWLMKDADGDIWATTGERPAWNGNDGEWGADSGAWSLARAVHADLYAAFKDVPPELSLIENPKRTKA